MSDENWQQKKYVLNVSGNVERNLDVHDKIISEFY